MNNFYKAISDPTRRRILQLLSQKEHTQSELVNSFSITQPAIIKHLKILKDIDLISERKEAKYRYYKLNKEKYNECYHLLKDELGLLLETKLDQLKNTLEEGDD